MQTGRSGFVNYLGLTLSFFVFELFYLLAAGTLLAGLAVVRRPLGDTFPGLVLSAVIGVGVLLSTFVATWLAAISALRLLTEGDSPVQVVAFALRDLRSRLAGSPRPERLADSKSSTSKSPAEGREASQEVRSESAAGNAAVWQAPAKVDPDWSLQAFLRWYDPHPGWRPWFAKTYAKAIESTRPEEQLEGWKAAAMIFGDMHAVVFCLFVCDHGRSLVPPDSNTFAPHIDLCLWDLGLAMPARRYEGSMPIVDIGKPETFRRDARAAREWLAEQLRPFDGDVERAAVFAMRYAAVRFGLLRGPSEPSIEEVLDESLWKRAGSDFGLPVN